MQRVISAEQLEVIGYTDPVTKFMLPCIVAPIFRVRDHPDKVLVPPFRIVAEGIIGGTELHSEEIQQLHNAEEVVLFLACFPARTGFTLWLDDRGTARYDASAAARSWLDEFADWSVGRAEEEFGADRLEEAERLCSAAISANDYCLKAFVIKAAIRRRKGDSDGERLIAMLAAPCPGDVPFALLVEEYCRAGRAE